MAEYVDYFAKMAYDIHGTWDGNSEWTDSVINPHTNITEISAGLDLLWRNNIDPAKVLLGLGFYGRSFTLEDSSCNTPGCAFSTTSGSGGARAGECTGTSGILSDYEISRIIDDYSVNVHYDEAAGVNWMTWSGDQWYGLDDDFTTPLTWHIGSLLTMAEHSSRRPISRIANALAAFSVGRLILEALALWPILTI